MTATASPATDAHAPLAALGAALMLGMLGDALFHGARLGINLPLWVGAMIAAASWLVYRFGLANSLPDHWMMVAMGFASALVIRANPMVRAFDVLAVVLALGLVSLRHYGEAATSRVREYVVALGRIAAHLAGAVLALFGDIRWLDAWDTRTRARARRIAAGLVVGIPVALVFLGLFSTAEPVLKDVVSALTQWIGPEAVQHVVFTTFVAWVAAALLRAWLWSPRRRAAVLEAPTPAFASETVLVALGAMPALFAVFLGLQARELLGGDQWVQATTGLSYGEFARQGFYQTVAATVLSLPLLYGGCVVLAGGDARGRSSVRALAVVQLVLNGLVTASAVNRLRLVIVAYGLTPDRIIGAAVMLWLVCTSIWFAATVLRGRPERFTFGAIASGFGVLAALNTVNPGALMAGVHMTRVAAGRQMDRAFVTELSHDADAVPVLVASLRALPKPAACYLVKALDSLPPAAADWRSWSVPERKARRITASLSNQCP